MMNKKRTSQVGWGKYLLTLPLFAVLLMVSYACKNKTEKDTNVQNKVVAEAVDTVITKDTVAVPQPIYKTIKFTAPKIEKGIKTTVKFTAPVIISHGNDSVYYGIEQMPIYPGGPVALMKYISENLHYPQDAKDAGIEGRVIIRFIVSKTGQITNDTIIRGLNESCNKEALRVVKAMPKWEPGKNKGEPVNVYYTLPITFKLNF